MKKAAIVAIIGLMFLVLTGITLAKTAIDVVAEIDAQKGTMILKDGTQFDNVATPLLKGFKKGDPVMVIYSEEGGKKVVTKITQPAISC